MIFLDLRWKGQLGEEHTKAFDQLALEIQQEFVRFISDLSTPFSDNLDWWVEAVGSRNIFASPLYFRICGLLYVEKLLRDGKNLQTIRVDSIQFASLLEHLLLSKNSDCKVLIDNRRIKQFKSQVAPYWLFLKYIIQARIIKWLIQKYDDQHINLILIDTFISPGFECEDRYYPGLWDLLNSHERSIVHFVPTFYGYTIFGIFSVIRKLCELQKKWLFKESYLQLSDYLYAFLHWDRVKNIHICDCKFRNHQLSPMINEELDFPEEYGSAFIGLLNYRFFMRIKAAGLKLNRIIDWSENQVIDKGWNAGVNRYYPESDSVGYQGYIVTPHYLVMYPTSIEWAAGVLPKKLAVIGEGFIQSRKKYCPEIDVETMPAFRFSGVYEDNTASYPSTVFTILVALPKAYEEAADILKTIGHSWSGQIGDDCRWLLKFHPTQKKRKLKSYYKKFTGKLEEMEDSYDELVRKAHLVISSASSVCMETIARGVPVIVVAGARGFIHNPIPEEISKEIWQLCYTQGEIIQAVIKFKSIYQDKSKWFQEYGRQIRGKYFQPVTSDGVKKMLGLA